jgi:hypothetical protein
MMKSSFTKQQLVTSKAKGDGASPAVSPIVSDETVTTPSSRYSLRTNTKRDYAELAGEESDDSEQEYEELKAKVKKVKSKEAANSGFRTTTISGNSMELVAKNRLIAMLKKEIESLQVDNERLKQEKESLEIESQRSKQTDVRGTRYYMFSPAFPPGINSASVAADPQEHYILSFQPPSPSALVLDECTDLIANEGFSTPQCRK